MLKLVHDATADAVGESEASTIELDELCRLAAKEMLAVALLAERRAYLEEHATERDATGHRLVVGNGYARPREVVTGAGAVEVTAARVDDRREGERFSSSILPPYMRKFPKVTEVLPVLYLRGLSTGDFAPALGEFFGTEAGLSASTVNRLTEAWQHEHAEHVEWSTRSKKMPEHDSTPNAGSAARSSRAGEPSVREARVLATRPHVGRPSPLCSSLAPRSVKPSLRRPTAGLDLARTRVAPSFTVPCGTCVARHGASFRSGPRITPSTGASSVVGTGVDPVTSRFSGARSAN
jgi:hypothetical protein